jgi:hypothetical protein
MAIDFGIAAIVGLGALASTFFFNVLNRTEKKVDQVADKVDHLLETMVTKDGCQRRHRSMMGAIKGHLHENEKVVFSDYGNGGNGA